MTTLKEAQSAGKISIGNTKMPGSTFAVSAKHCNVGGKLADLEGSVCYECYALRLQNFRPTVNAGWTGNLDKANRWFDSGDLQSVEMLEAICEVARTTPQIRHWLPTRETKIINDFTGSIPDNLIVRVSSPMIDDKPINKYIWTSTVHKNSEPVGHICPARHQGNACGSCRACWSDDIRNISYPLH